MRHIISKNSSQDSKIISRYVISMPNQPHISAISDECKNLQNCKGMQISKIDIQIKPIGFQMCLKEQNLRYTFPSAENKVDVSRGGA